MAAEQVVETADGTQVRISRTPGAPLMMLVRMASHESGIWDPVWEGLTGRFTVASFDLMQAARLQQDMAPGRRFGTLAEVVVRVAAGLGFPQFHLFAWYGGCHVALAALRDHAARIASCILLDPFFALEDMRKVEKAIAFKRAIFETDRALYAYYWVMAGFSPAFMERRFEVIERLAQARIEKDRFVKEDVERWLRWVRALRTNWLDDAELAAMTTPTLVLASELDSWHAGPTVGMARALQARLPASELTELKGVGTFGFIERPGLFLEAAGPFLARNAGAGAP
ncbi:MAG: alpha/beta fold hydrolase [Geminicoccaceae bacterium]